jgi:hypothetical protein
MATETEFVDPRSNVTHPIEEGQVYVDSRTDDECVLVYEADDAVLLRDEENGGHRLEPRDHFENNVGAGRYELQGSDEMAVQSGAVGTLRELIDDYEDQDGRTAKHYVQALDEALTLIENNGRPDDNDVIDFESIDGIGPGAADNLVQHGFRTKGDVRSASTEEIKSVPLMGESNTQNLLQSVGNGQEVSV